MRRVALGILGAVAAAGCAVMTPPPGGPPDPTPPQLVRAVPESGSVRPNVPEVRFLFDEVVSEQPPAGGQLGIAGLVLVSPYRGEPDVRWRRDEIVVRQRRGWRPNTTYTVRLLPGLADLRGNARRDEIVLVFSTGGEPARGRIDGVVFDWAAGTPAARAWIEAVGADSTTWVAFSDSSGRFTIPFVPAGRYVVRTLVDQNSNRRREPREKWDSTVVELRDSARVESYAFVHDTVGARLGAVAVRDSLTLAVTLDQPAALDEPAPANWALLRPDSSRVPIDTVLTAAVWDSLRTVRDRLADSVRRDSVARADTSAASRARRDSAARQAPAAVPLPAPRRAPADTSAAAPGDTLGRRRAGAPVPTRPRPASEFVIRLREPLAPATSYRLRVTDLRNLTGKRRSSERGFVTPRPQPPRDTAARRATPPAAGQQPAPTPAPPAQRPPTESPALPARRP